MKNRGFIGLIVLLITCAIIALVLVRTGLFLPKTEEGTEQKSIIEKDLEAVQSAKDIKTMLEMQSKTQAEGI